MYDVLYSGIKTGINRPDFVLLPGQRGALLTSFCIKAGRATDNKKSTEICRNPWPAIIDRLRTGLRKKTVHAMNLFNNITVCISGRKNIQI